jgi:hypothetical protein
MTTLMRHLVLASLLTGGAAQAADITVDGSSCTLADAITAANTDAAAGGCPAGFDADTITLEADITLEAALPEISSEITVEGGGHIISGNNSSSVGSVLRVASTGSLTLNEAAVTGSNSSTSGGGIYNNGGEVTLNSSVIRDNRTMGGGGGIYNDGGEVTLNSSVISGNGCLYGGGGAIDSRNGEVIINDSLLAANSSRGEGGIVIAKGVVTLTRSTVSGNTGRDGAGGIGNAEGTLTLTDSAVTGNTGASGGISNSAGGAATLTNSTISGNATRMSNRGGAIYNSGTASLINVTVSGSTSGGGIYNNAGASLSLRGSIVSGNMTNLFFGDAAEIVNDVNGVITTEGFNVFGHAGETSAQAFSGFTPGADDVNAASDGGKPTQLAAILSPLADNGGPTQTHALPVCSPAVDLDELCGADLTADQRGVSRPSGAGCDAGAFEFNGKRRGCGASRMRPVHTLLLLHQK